jgi:hypothetical protein
LSESADSPRTAPDEGVTTASLIEAAPGLARIAATAWWHTAGWTVSATARAYGGVVRAAVNSSTPGEFFEQTGGEIRDYARNLLGIVDSEGRIRDAVGLSGSRSDDGRDDTTELRERGARLLEESADVRFVEDLHPAFARILEEITPDEARILRLLALEGAQPAVDIRAGIPMVSDLVKSGLSMIDAEAGLRHTDRLRGYLTNLNRLGLIWFSRERLRDPHRYQVLEAQPEVLEAMKKGGRTARTVRRSILLTQFGDDFCRTVLPLQTAEMEALPQQPAQAAPDKNAEPELEPQLETSP